MVIHLTSSVGFDGEITALSVIDVGNSTTTPLSGGENFTGVGKDVLLYRAVTILIRTDANSATDGMKFEFSSDGTNWDESNVFTYTVDGARRFQFAVTARFFRVNYTTKAGAPGNQTFFRMQTILHPFNVITSIHRLGDDTDPDRSAQLVKAIILAQINGVGDFMALQSNAAGILKVAPGNIEVNDAAVTDANPVPVSDAGGSVTVDMLSFIDANNSTTTPLSGGATFTGTATDLLPFQAITIQILTDGNSAVDGMKFEFSPDGTNWDDSYLFTYLAADGSRRFQFSPTAKFFRVVFAAAAGGPGNQSFIRLQVLLHPSAVLTTIHRVGDDTSPDRSAQLMKTVLMAQKGGAGDFIPLQSNAAGILKVSPGNMEVLDAAVDFSNPVPVAIVAKKIKLTGSIDGKPIPVTAFATPGDVVDLTAGLGAGEGFAYFLKASFVTQAAAEEDATLTLEFGGATVSELMTFSIPLEDAIVIAVGESLYANALTVAAFVGTSGQQVNVTGWKELVIP